jgi:hypothetical protein
MGTLIDRKARENYGWEVIQDIIDKEVSSAFKLKEPIMPTKKDIKQKKNAEKRVENYRREKQFSKASHSLIR